MTRRFFFLISALMAWFCRDGTRNSSDYSGATALSPLHPSSAFGSIPSPEHSFINVTTGK